MSQELQTLSNATVIAEADLIYLLQDVAGTPTGRKALISLLRAALFGGKAGGQTLIGGTAASELLTLQSTAHATRGNIALDGADLTLLSTMRARMAAQNRFRHLNSVVSAVKSSSQTALAVNTYATIVFNSEDFDTDALHDPVTNNSRLTAAIAGKYLATLSVFADSTGATTPTEKALRIIRNGSTSDVFGDNRAPIVSGITAQLISTSAILSLGAADYIEGQLNIAAASGTFSISSAASLTRFSMAYLGE